MMEKRVGQMGGKWQVVITANTDAGPFRSRLYVNHGLTPTIERAEHKTLTGATAWARRILAKEIC